MARRKQKSTLLTSLTVAGLVGIASTSVLLAVVFPTLNLDIRNWASTSEKALTCDQMWFEDTFDNKKLSKNYWKASGATVTEFVNAQLRIVLKGEGKNKTGYLKANSKVKGEFQTHLYVNSYELLNAEAGNGSLGLQIETPRETYLLAVKQGSKPGLITRRILNGSSQPESPQPSPSTSPWPSVTPSPKPTSWPSPSPSPSSSPVATAQPSSLSLAVDENVLNANGITRKSPEEFEMAQIPQRFLLTIERFTDGTLIMWIESPGQGRMHLAKYPGSGGDAKIQVVSTINAGVKSGRSRAILDNWTIRCINSIATPTPSPTSSPRPSGTPYPSPWPTPSPSPSSTSTPYPSPSMWPSPSPRPSVSPIPVRTVR